MTFSLLSETVMEGLLFSLCLWDILIAKMSIFLSQF